MGRSKYALKRSIDCLNDLNDCLNEFSDDTDGRLAYVDFIRDEVSELRAA